MNSQRKGFFQFSILAVCLIWVAWIKVPRFREFFSGASVPSSIAAARSVAQTDACSGSKNSDLVVSLATIRRIYFKGRQTILIPSSMQCLRQGETYLLHALESDQAFGRVQIKSIHVVPFESLDADIVSEPPDFNTAADIKKWLVVQHGPEVQKKPIARVDFELVDRSNPPTRGFSRVEPRIQSAAKLIGADEFKALRGEAGLQIVDVRTPAEFARHHLTDAVNIPYMIRNGWGFDLSTILETTDLFDLTKITKDHEKPIVVYGSGVTDIRADRFAIELLVGGWTRVFYYRDALDEELGIHYLSPESLPGVTVASAADVLQLEGAGARVIDVRSRAEFVRSHIGGALNDPFTVSSKRGNRKDMGVLDGFTIPSSIRDFSETGESIDVNQLPRDRNSPVVFYGYDERDWDAAKAAIFAQFEGWKKVYFFRKGLAEWAELSYIDTRYNIVPDRPANGYK